jgi:hypothetical protein
VGVEKLADGGIAYKYFSRKNTAKFDDSTSSEEEEKDLTAS